MLVPFPQLSHAFWSIVPLVFENSCIGPPFKVYHVEFKLPSSMVRSNLIVRLSKSWFRIGLLMVILGGKLSISTCIDELPMFPTVSFA